MKAVLFDFDGVIVDTFDLHLATIQAYGKGDLTSDDFRDAFRGNIFDTQNVTLRTLDWEKFRDHVSSAMISHQPVSCSREVIEQLAREHLLFIITSSHESAVSRYLKHHGFSGKFREVLGREFHFSKVKKFRHVLNTYNIGSEECLFVTDTLGDIREAKEVGVKTIGVDYGFHSREYLEEGDPYGIVSRFEDILEYV